MNILKPLLLLTISLFIVFTINAQTDCKVLVDELKGDYDGKCKKGLAHGKAVASGIDNYEGFFRKGLPNGFGVYTWKTGEIYSGEWVDGQRSGEGAYSYEIDGRDTTIFGKWKSDEYIGPDPEGAKVLYSRYIHRYEIRRDSDGDRIFIDIRLNGSTNRDLLDLTVLSTSGSYFESGRSIGLETIAFPVIVRVKYLTWNRTHTFRLDAVFEFEIKEAGNWQVNIDN